MGRKSFMKNDGHIFEDELTVYEFIVMTEIDFGGSIIRMLKDKIKLNKK